MSSRWPSRQTDRKKERDRERESGIIPENWQLWLERMEADILNESQHHQSQKATQGLQSKQKNKNRTK